MGTRRATPEDAPAIAEVHTRAWQVGYRGQLPDSFLDGLDTGLERRLEGWTRATVDPDLDVFVAEVDGLVVGFSSSSASRDPDFADDGELQAIYVLGASWGKGFGSALLEASVTALTARGYPSALLWVLAGNDRSIRFYERHGWALDGAEKTEPWGDLELHEVRMVRPL